MLTILVGLSVILTGLMAGFFFAYWCSVMVGLRSVSDETFVETMQHINAVLPNAMFAPPFFGALLVPAIAAWIAFSDGKPEAGWWLVVSFVFYVVTFVITAVRNVPMNNALAQAGAPHDAAGAIRIRAEFEGPWVRWNAMRTATNLASFAAAVIALAA